MPDSPDEEVGGWPRPDGGGISMWGGFGDRRTRDDYGFSYDGWFVHHLFDPSGGPEHHDGCVRHDHRGTGGNNHVDYLSTHADPSHPRHPAGEHHICAARLGSRIRTGVRQPLHHERPDPQELPDRGIWRAVVRGAEGQAAAAR